MNRMGTAFGTAFGLALLVALVAGGYLLLEYIGGVFTSLAPPVRTLAAIGSVVALLSAFIIANGLRARGAPADQAQRVVIYERLLSACCEQWRRPESAHSHAAGELAETERSLSLLGGAGVISAYLRLKRAKHDDAPEAMRTDLLKRLVAEMRRDLGRSELIRKESELLELLTEPGRDYAATRRAADRAVHE